MDPEEGLAGKLAILPDAQERDQKRLRPHTDYQGASCPEEMRVASSLVAA